MRAAVVAAFLGAASGAGASSGGSSSISIEETNLGACSGGAESPAATLRVHFAHETAANPTDVFKLYRDGTLVDTEGAFATYFDYEVTGFVYDGPASRFTSSWVFRVDLCTAGGVVIETISAAPWVRVYGACS